MAVLTGKDLLAGIIRETREMSGMSLRDFAEMSNPPLAWNTIRRLEEGDIKPHKKSLELLSTNPYIKNLYTFEEIEIIAGADSFEQVAVLICRTAFGVEVMSRKLNEEQKIRLILKIAENLPKDGRKKISTEIVNGL